MGRQLVCMSSFSFNQSSDGNKRVHFWDGRWRGTMVDQLLKCSYIRRA